MAFTLVLTTAALCQSAPENLREGLSNREAREAATYIEEATVPPGPVPTEFTVRISVGKDGAVKDVSNPHSLPDPLFAAAADAARRWRFPDRGKRNGFEAEITFHAPIAGRVTARDGKPIEGVVVSGSEWKCCPAQRDAMTTDASGSFRIEHPGSVLHFAPRDGFQPQLLVVTPEMLAPTITLDPPASSFSLAACGKPQSGFERIGWGKYGLQFDAPSREVRLTRGKADVDYVVDIIRAKNGNDRVEFWFGPNAMSSTPDDKQLVESEVFVTRNVVMPPGLVVGSGGGVIGMDTRGSQPNGEKWRQVAIGFEGARYRDVTPANAALFDSIIDSACWIAYPKD